MNKNYIIPIVIVVLLIIFGGFVFLGNKMENNGTSGQTNTVSNTSTTTQTGVVGNTTDKSVKETVTYNGTSFSPNSITIKKGDTVMFVNQSSGGMEVASNPHPTHTDYPEFDQYKSSQRSDQTYVFTFDRVGTWGYHNHVNPAVKGTVVVNP